MTNSPNDKRSRLVHTAMELVHRQGFYQTTLADVAQEAGIPLGNVYYYFKTKEDLGHAVVEQHASSYRMLRETWDSLPEPKTRLSAFVQMTLDNLPRLTESGCPIGTLCAELQKDGGALAENVSSLFAETLTWLAAQFRELGKGEESDDLALHVLSVLEGATLLTHSFHKSSVVETEARRLKAWIASL